MDHFQFVVTTGDWEQVQKYISNFIKFNSDEGSKNILFDICRQKFLEALDRQGEHQALEILRKELKMFFVDKLDDPIFNELVHLITHENFREHEIFLRYESAAIARDSLFNDLKKLIHDNPCLKGKLKLPSLGSSRLMTIADQSLRWQYHYCSHCYNRGAVQLPPGVTLFVDKAHGMPGAFASSSTRDPLTELSLGLPNMSAGMTPSSQKRSRPYDGQSYPWSTHYSKDLPMTILMTLSECSAILSMDFHPTRFKNLLVGTSSGDVSLWDLSSKSRLAHMPFEIWTDYYRSLDVESTSSDPSLSANCVKWSPDGKQFGAAYSACTVHIYNFHAGDEIELTHGPEIVADAGAVYDIAFCQLDQKPCILTYGYEKVVKVWDAANGHKKFILKNHGALGGPEYPSLRELVQCIFSTSVDGKIKAWLYDNSISKVALEISNHAMCYGADANRLFSSGINNNGESQIVKWNESEGTIRRSYAGVHGTSMGVVQLGTIRDQFLVVGDEFMVKFWEMDNGDMLTTTNAEGELPARPFIRISKEGMLLVVSANDNCIKILANSEDASKWVPFEPDVPSTHVECSGSRLGVTQPKLKASSSSGAGTPVWNYEVLPSFN